VAALHGELLGQVGHRDGVADGDLAHHGGGGTGEAAAGAGLVALLPALRALRARGAAAGAVGRREVQLAGEARRVLVVLDAGDHGRRPAVLLAGAAVVAGRGRLRMAVAVGLARRRLFHRRGGGGLGLRAQALGLGLLGAATGLLGLLRAAAVGLGQALLLLEVALARLLELAQDLGALVVHAARRARRGARLRLHQRDLLAHDHVDRRLVAAAAHGERALALQGDLARRDR